MANAAEEPDGPGHGLHDGHNAATPQAGIIPPDRELAAYAEQEQSVTNQAATQRAPSHRSVKRCPRAKG
jgi:hypothetical protein